MGLSESWSPVQTQGPAYRGGCQAQEEKASQLEGRGAQPAPSSGPSLGLSDLCLGGAIHGPLLPFCGLILSPDKCPSKSEV